MATFEGTDGDDIFFGSNADDTFYPYLGNDVVDGGGIAANGNGDVLVLDYSEQKEALHMRPELGESIYATCGSNMIGFVKIEHLQLTATSLSDVLRGTAGSDTLIASEGDDVISGGEFGGDDLLLGGNGDDSLYAGAGTPTLIGGRGDDYYQITDSYTFSVVELDKEGTDTISIMTGQSYTLPAFTENLIFESIYWNNGTGNDLDNVITGNRKNNVLDGGRGNDTMAGGEGADTYVVDSADDAVTEKATAKKDEIDAVKSKVSYELGENLENLYLLGNRAQRGTGTSVDNLIVGSSAANTLIGREGDDTLRGGRAVDTLIGGFGNDLYVVDNSGDLVSKENASPTEMDSVRASVSYALGSNVENLTLTRNATSGTGNRLANLISGNSAGNRLLGENGDDTLVGAGGNDTLIGFSLEQSGKQEVDRLIGGAGADTFSLGTSEGAFYDDQRASSKGVLDYAFILDFSVSKDALILSGSASNYHLGSSPITGLPGTGLFFETGATDELIAVIQTVNSRSLTTSNTISDATFV